MKLTKQQQKIQKQALDMLKKETWSLKDKEFIYNNLNEGGLSDITTGAAFFY